VYLFAAYLDGKNYFSSKYLAEAIARWPEFKEAYLFMGKSFMIKY